MRYRALSGTGVPDHDQRRMNDPSPDPCCAAVGAVSLLSTEDELVSAVQELEVGMVSACRVTLVMQE